MCNQGGFSDRMFGILQTFALCKISEQPFKLHYIFPFNLITFLIPNEYNWVLSAGDICYDRRTIRTTLRDAGR